MTVKHECNQRNEDRAKKQMKKGGNVKLKSWNQSCTSRRAETREPRRFFFFRHLRCNICPLVAANERPASPFRFKNEVNFIKGLRKNEEEDEKKGENAGSCKVCVRVNGRETVGRVCLLHVANG